eukprot:13221610-Heterocapsa_arctica.AAC.1
MCRCAIDVDVHRCNRFVSSLALKAFDCRCDESLGKVDHHEASSYMEVERVARSASKLGQLITTLEGTDEGLCIRAD